MDAVGKENHAHYAKRQLHRLPFFKKIIFIYSQNYIICLDRMENADFFSNNGTCGICTRKSYLYKTCLRFNEIRGLVISVPVMSEI
jgi:hypothetical protein